MFKSNLLKLFLRDKGTRRFALAVTAGFAFSMSVILGNIGIMDGFEGALRLGLKKSSGDLTIYARHGFFQFENYLKHELELENLEVHTPMIQTEGFIIKDESSKGVLIKGIERESFEKVTGLHLGLQESQVVLGSELASFLRVEKGDFIVLALANGNDQVSGLPALKRYEVSGVIEHGIYQRDLRTLYMSLNELQRDLKVESKVNLIAANISKDSNDFYSDPLTYSLKVDELKEKLKEKLGRGYRIRAYWHDFTTLITAVKEEKFFISIILQIIVVISIFNVLAFVVFLNEKRSKELFLFKALGMSQKDIKNGWIQLMSAIWIGACALSIGLVSLFNLGLKYLPMFKLPGDVYTLGEISIKLDLLDYGLVFFISYVWLILISWFALYSMSKKSVLSGLRKEFS